MASLDESAYNLGTQNLESRHNGADHEFFGTAANSAGEFNEETSGPCDMNGDIIEDLKKSRSPSPAPEEQASPTDLVGSMSGYPITSDEELPIDQLSNLAQNLKKVRKKKSLLNPAKKRSERNQSFTRNTAKNSFNLGK